MAHRCYRLWLDGTEPWILAAWFRNVRSLGCKVIPQHDASGNTSSPRSQKEERALRVQCSAYMWVCSKSEFMRSDVPLRHMLTFSASWKCVTFSSILPSYPPAKINRGPCRGDAFSLILSEWNAMIAQWSRFFLSNLLIERKKAWLKSSVMEGPLNGWLLEYLILTDSRIS